MRIGTRGIGAILFVLTFLFGSARGSDDLITDGGPAVDVSGGSAITGPGAVGFGSATFESYAEGSSYKPSFTDADSGIFFSNSTAANGNFVIEYASGSNWTAPMFQNNKYLGANGYAPGNGASLPAEFGFTGTLPQWAKSVELDVAGDSSTSASLYSMTLTIQDMDGVTLGSDTVNFNSNLPQEYHLTASSTKINIARFLLVPGTNGFDAVDNINAIVPEPSDGVAAAVGVMSLCWMRGHRRMGCGRL